jgi:phage terminase Nu1 subunit (DNA packaging protein)
MTETTTPPATMKKGDFARFLGLAPSYITALVKAGRVVTEGEGRGALVKVAESVALIEATQAGRFDVARRHAAARRRGQNEAQGDALVRSTPENAPKRDSESHDPERLVDAKTRKESAQADQEEMKAAQMAGNLIAREDVDAAMKFLGASVRAAMDVFPDQTAPVLCAVTDLNETHALLTEACRNVLHDIGVAIERQFEQMARPG